MEITKKANSSTVRTNYAAQSSSDNKQGDSNRKKLTIAGNYLVKHLIPVGTFYKTYKGIAINQNKYVTVYIKPLKLLDKIDSAGYVIRTLSLRNIIMSQSYTKNDVYLLNTFDLQRKNQQIFNTYDLKYCSIGCHLKLSKQFYNLGTCSKDTLQSMCYILMDFYLRGSLFDNKIQRQKDFLQAKNLLKTDGVPIVFLQFYQYVKNLNHNDQVKFTQWKIKFKKCVPQQQFMKPYQWITAANQKSKVQSQNSDSIQNQQKNKNQLFNLNNFFQKLIIQKSNVQQKQQKNQKIIQKQPQISDFQDQQNQDLFDQGQLSKYQQKLYDNQQFLIKKR